MFEIKNLKMTLGAFNLSCDQLSFPTSGVTALRGTSGSGKTTFFRVLTGELTPNSWSWSLDGTVMSDLEMSKRHLGVVFQSYDLFPNLTASENIQIVMRSRGHSDANSEDRLQKFKAKLELGKCWNTKAERLSGGEQQRTALLRALMSNPRYLLLDEPFSALNSELRDESRQLVKEVLLESKIGALLITHDERDVSALADREILISDGKFSNAAQIRV